MATPPVEEKPFPQDNASDLDMKDKEALNAEAALAADVDYRGSGLKRTLKARHLSFISIGACIG